MATAVRRTAAMRALWAALKGSNEPGAVSVGQRLGSMPRMLRLGFTGRYPYLAKGRLGLCLLAMLYVLSPVDLVPELFVPILGLGDDAVVMAWLAGTVLSETDAFLRWERAEGEVVIGEVIE